MRRLRLGAAVAMAVNSVRQFVPPTGPTVAVYRLADGYFATDDRCTHGEAELSEGDIEGDEIVCPFHLGKFAIRTGEPTAAPCFAALRCHRVTLAEDGNLYLDWPE